MEFAFRVAVGAVQRAEASQLRRFSGAHSRVSGEGAAGGARVAVPGSRSPVRRVPACGGTGPSRRDADRTPAFGASGSADGSTNEDRVPRFSGVALGDECSRGRGGGGGNVRAVEWFFPRPACGPRLSAECGWFALCSGGRSGAADSRGLSDSQWG